MSVPILILVSKQEQGKDAIGTGDRRVYAIVTTQSVRSSTLEDIIVHNEFKSRRSTPPRCNPNMQPQEKQSRD
ncbi:hypothetical protein SCLCIDRAFT_1099139 [Scleroderma citrinum Foug A]|uniref:Uncharacterized protein n=1 Tax=Scleroderma citrinum Foug A TaxID=1036808 RepID=A0A0C3A0K0_9AGAM|nr:hypothetical protein SCLCIDRAFT_1099139 [Scleroderma citrinum Foug A]